MFSLIDLIKSSNTGNEPLEKIGILDIGAMLLEDSPPEYSVLSNRGQVKVIGFEPVSAECEKLNLARKNSNIQFLPYFIGDGSKQKFYMTSNSMTASLFEPNQSFLDMFQHLGILTSVTGVEEVQTKRLDDIKEIDFPIDYIKMDIQGAELQALEGAQNKLLKNVLVIQTEVSWVPLYKNQPLFSELELFLRKHGFMMHQIMGHGTRALKQALNPGFNVSDTQQLWSDVVFIRDISCLSHLLPQQLLKMATILHDVYNSVDFALLLLHEYDKQTNSNFEQQYANKLTEDARTAASTGMSSHTSLLPHDFVSLYSFGVEAFNKNDFAQALSFFECALQQNRGFAQLWYNLGLCCGKLGKHQESLAHLNQAMVLKPDYEEARNLREGIVAELQNRMARSQQQPQLLSNYSERLAAALEMQSAGKIAEAEAIFLEILASSPNDVASLFSLGGIEHNRKNPEKALQFLERAVALNPTFPPLWYNLAIVLQSLKNFDKALESYDKALQLDPGNLEVMTNRGGLLAEMKRHKDALLNYEELLKVDPNNQKALCNRGILLTDVKFHDLAIHTFDRLFKLNPEYEFVAGLLGFAKMHACDWNGLDEIREAVVQGVKNGKRVCQTLPLTAITDDPMIHLQGARIFGQFYCPPQKPLWNGEIFNHQKIRIGYVSPDLREHPVGHLTTGLFEAHDKNRFEIIAFSLGIDDQSLLQKRMRTAFDKFIDVRTMRSKDIAAMIRTMEIDILVDMAGYTADSRTDIFAFHPVPIQVNYLGYSSTMGVDYIDYIIADRYIIPEDQRQFYSEKVVYMPDTYLPTDASVKISETPPPRKQYGLPETGFIFCSFNHDYKINPAIFDVWMRLLKNKPGSVLWLMKLNESAERNLRQEAENRGIDPARIIFATRVDKIEDHLARYRMADLFLDTTPCNAHSTASDVLRAGLPIITCRGRAFAGRVAASLLELMGLPELVTTSLHDYERLATKIADDPNLLQNFKDRLQKNLTNAKLFDTDTYCRNLEKAYTIMWQRYQGGEASEAFIVE
ncbi:MAG TPA: FkbM family methyltransferase [Candidatus Rifleibacterium sp.]|nr:FkbM family methyltransferase [Candidatus Rifleibacterium sp.]HPT45936.1 FkbM family methyltransferase [Candidatus Rifleibacterium sp.]